MRIFISLELPETLKAKIFHNFEKLKNSGTCSGNFVSKNNLHITLRFLGELSEDKIEELIKVFSNFSSSSFEISLGKKGYFPDKDYIRVLWLSLISDKLTDFFSKIEEVLQNLGYEKEKDFVFHLTVARIKSIKNKKLFSEILNKIKDINDSFEVKQFSIIKSELVGKEPVYKVLSNFSLK